MSSAITSLWQRREVRAVVQGTAVVLLLIACIRLWSVGGNAVRLTKAGVASSTKSNPRGHPDGPAKNHSFLVLSGAPRRSAEWVDFHQKLVDEVAAADKRQGWEVIFYGDSITESYRQTEIGAPCRRQRCKGVPEVFEKHFGSKYRAHVLAIAGDQTGHLLWRLTEGEAPARHAPTVVVIMIGVNDLNAARRDGMDPTHAVPGIATRYRESLQYLRKHYDKASIILLAVLPCGSGRGKQRYDWPNAITKARDALNAQIEETAASDEKMQYLDCGAGLMSATNSSRLDAELMPDALHPNAKGMEIVVKCLQPLVDKAMKEGRRR